MLQTWFVVAILFVAGTCTCSQNRTGCDPKSQKLLNRIDTTELLVQLRLQIDAANIDALIIPMDDEHQNEFVGPPDQRIKFISGFTGSAGSVIVTKNKAILWTDGRYHIQADKELDCNWSLMRSGLPNVPKMEEWLLSEFPNGAKIGADPKVIPAANWIALEKNLSNKNSTYTLVKTSKNLVDEIWKDKPQLEIKQAFVLDLVYSGETWQEKVNRTRQKLKKLGADAMIITTLDEIAWLFNLRGYDIPYTPVVKSYIFLSKSEVILFIDERKIPDNFKKVYQPDGQEEVKYEDYESIWTKLPSYILRYQKILLPSAISFNLGVSKEIYDLVPETKRLVEPSPIVYLKAVKNPSEIEYMEHAHLQDAVALCQFFQYLDEHLSENDIDEFQAAEILADFRSKGKKFISLSFPAIVGYGPHGALPHYSPTRESSIPILNGSLLVVDSGGHYLGGTTDITRTVSIGNPTDEQKEAFTRVLMGVIDFSSFVFPATLNGSQVDLLARGALWEIGYDYLHGSGHGVGSFLLVHEAPINLNYQAQNDGPLKPGYFTSIEPGFYLEDKFGIRIENVVRVIEKTNLKYQSNKKYFGFKTIILFPFDVKLIDFNLLSKKHIAWLKAYYTEILEKVGEELKIQNKLSTYDWLVRQLTYMIKQ